MEDDKLSARSDRTTSSKASSSKQATSSYSGIKNFSLFDVTLDPFKQKEMDNIIRANIIKKQEIKMNSPTFKGSNPVAPSGEGSGEVFKPSVKKAEFSGRDTFSLSGDKKTNEIQWKPCFKKADTVSKAGVSDEGQKRQLKGVPEVKNFYERNPLFQGDPFSERSHIHGQVGQEVSREYQTNWEKKTVLPADRKVAPPRSPHYQKFTF